ncbi:vitamin K epoxide reductase family protein [Pedobacter sp. ASV28]|uniref:vitamin K epoxide reductase family protein n=1 Tax=Pedobacter sp. ASV28 TaxID=2795123 RepID=UPI0018EDA6F0|nr:vitamin K epoxide reductase family protein [Pedobacter sp. ASV28]
MLNFNGRYDNLTSATIYLINQLGIRVHPRTIQEELLAHPDYPSLLAVSDSLSQWSIPSGAYYIDKDNYDPTDLSYPFIAHTHGKGGRFILVKSISNNRVFYSNENSSEMVDTEEKFLKSWSGYILCAYPNEKSGDTRYKSQVLKSTIESLKLPFGILLLIAILTLGFSATIINWQYISIIALKLIGVFVSVLLLIQSFDANNPLIKNICGLAGSNSDCNAILKSEASKVTSWLNWSEVGFFYFSGTFLFLIFQPGLLQPIALLNLLALPYTIYSISYQYRAKTWCVLCCSVQVILLAEAMVLAYNSNYSFSSLNIDVRNISIAIISFIGPIILWAMLKPFFVKASQQSELKNQLKKFKYNIDLFNEQLQKQPKFYVDSNLHPVVLGNPSSSITITMISNPYCNPCAKAHRTLSEWLKFRDDLQVKVVFTSGDDEQNYKTKASRHLSALRKHYDMDIAEKAMNEWYNSVRKNYEAWAEKYPVEITNDIKMSMDAQKNWIDMLDIEYTPAFLINGYKLPDNYKLEEIKFLLN